MSEFCQGTLDFLYFNHKYNSKAWYHEHKDDFKKYLSEPFKSLVENMAPSMLAIDSQIITEPKSIVSRLYKDLRFAKDKTCLYRDHMWLTFMRGTNAGCGLPGYFFEISPYNFRYGCGYYMADAKSMAKLRELALASSPVFAKAKECYEQQNIFKLVGENFKKARYADYPEDMRVWLEKKDMCFITSSQDINLLFSKDLAQILSEQFTLIKPLYDLMMTVESLVER